MLTTLTPLEKIHKDKFFLIKEIKSFNRNVGLHYNTHTQNYAKQMNTFSSKIIKKITVFVCVTTFKSCGSESELSDESNSKKPSSA